MTISVASLTAARIFTHYLYLFFNKVTLLLDIGGQFKRPRFTVLRLTPLIYGLQNVKKKFINLSKYAFIRW